MRSTNDLDRAFEHGMDALRRAVLAALSPQLSPRLSLDPVLQPAGHVLLSETATPGAASVGGPDGHSGSGPVGDEDRATSSEVDEAERERLIALVELARAGDKEAFGLLYDHYQASVYRFLYYRTRSQTLAEDLTSETFFRALRSMNSFRWQGKDFGAWLMTIARNLTMDHFKAGRTRLEMTTEDMTPHDDTTEGPEDDGHRRPHQRGAAQGAHRAAGRAARVPHHAVPAGPLDRRDGARPRPFRRRGQAAPAPRRAQSRQAAAGGVERRVTHPVTPAPSGSFAPVGGPASCETGRPR